MWVANHLLTRFWTGDSLLLAVVIDSYATSGTCLEFPGFEGLCF